MSEREIHRQRTVSCTHVCNNYHVVIRTKGPLLEASSIEAKYDNGCNDDCEYHHPYYERDTLTAGQHDGRYDARMCEETEASKGRRISSARVGVCSRNVI